MCKQLFVFLWRDGNHALCKLHKYMHKLHKKVAYTSLKNQFFLRPFYVFST